MKVQDFIDGIADGTKSAIEIPVFCKDYNFADMDIAELCNTLYVECLAASNNESANRLEYAYNYICKRYGMKNVFELLDREKQEPVAQQGEQPTPKEQQPEPQQETDDSPKEQQECQQHQTPNDEVVLPDVLNTQKTKAVFDEAIARGWMQPNCKGGYKWLGLKNWKRGQQQQCVYMFGQMYGYHKCDSGNDGCNLPSGPLGELFGINGVYSLLIKCHHAAKPQPWREAIDEMIATALQKMTASTSN